MNTLRKLFLFLAAFLVIALPLVLTGNAGAGYPTDGAVQDGVTGAWITPDDMVCILGVHTDGTLDIVGGEPNSRECIYYTTGLTGMAPIDVTSTHAPVVKAPTTYGDCKASNGNFVWDFVNRRCLDTAACSGTDTTTKGTLTWNAGDSKCYDSKACTVGKTPSVPPNDGAKHALATSICVDSLGNGIPLTDLDRTFAMCAAKGGTWKQTSDTLIVSGSGASATATVQVPATPGFGGACVAYGRQFRGQNDVTGALLPFDDSSKGPNKGLGTSATDAGFCYTTMNMTSAYSASTCPAKDSSGHPNTGKTSADAYDYSWTGSKCTYAKGIAGFPNATLTKADGTTYKSTTTWVDLSLPSTNTMGGCLANGGTWNNWVGQPTSTGTFATNPVPTSTTSKIPAWDFTKQSPETTNGCLHCHSKITQYNGPAERFKDGFLKHGHKNILRKVTPGKNWAGPDEDGVLSVYTGAATGPINFSAATAFIGGVWRDLLYIFGDWMTPAPEALDVIVDMGAEGAKYNGTGEYKCAACHTTGWSNPAAGLCSLSSYTTKAACEGALPTPGTWHPMVGVQGIGTPNFTSAEPAASFPTVTFTGAGKWDLDGIRCARCHNVTAPIVVNTQIANSAYPSTHVTNGGMGALASGVGRINLCFGCHQSIAKTNNGTGPDADLSHPENLPVTNAATAPGEYIPEFVDSIDKGSVIGNMFLNSVHGQFTGKIVPNALGKYDLEDPTTCVGTTCTGGNDNGNASKYNSKFQGFTCWQSATSTSPAQTMLVDVNGVKTIKEIKTKTDCEKLYSAGAWRSDNQGTCATCHDVHNSLFVEETKEAALRKVCTDCHNKTLSPKKTINHPDGPGTPLGFMAANGWEACVTCHMPRPTSSASRMHLWRINTDVDYRTFPTATEFGIGATATKRIANATPDGSYTNAVWVDVDYVCGQCHGGSFGPTATNNGASYYDKMFLSEFAKNMHINSAPNVSFTKNIVHLTVTLTDTSTGASFSPDLCLAISCYAITVNWGDKTSLYNGVAGGPPPSHTYTKAGKYKITYTVTDQDGRKSSKTITVAVR